MPTHLPGPNADVWDWQMRGSCRGQDSSVFFHPDGERGRARAQRELRAKEICKACPVLLHCRSHALKVSEPYGIWGGMSETERELHARRNRRRVVA
ncbi:WhiB family transcriptional regulator [Nocardia seriolae]|nr:WhiB family transcriptional regulator [Nocardia seriolae]GEM22724.1 transcriptional regulator WhiB [Nocardia seriolae NBRC 15557]BEK91048.1 WhiB family transcriptional regulator [Nocardia seriolae]BEK93230.1 WhiB family transcriptional regulator [Nocardia seriolae]GAM45246.1 WhiB family transcriptional regulator [Nocardia seriolae]